MENLDVNIKNWKSLIKPTKLDVQLSEDKSKAKIVAEPLEKGYGLTLGIHSRVESFCNYFSINAKVGNIYINRNQIGAVVESQPFGGVARSGTGPKAGGPDYLKQFVYEQSISNNVTAIGGNIELLG